MCVSELNSNFYFVTHFQSSEQLKKDSVNIRSGNVGFHSSPYDSVLRIEFLMRKSMQSDVNSVY